VGILNYLPSRSVLVKNLVDCVFYAAIDVGLWLGFYYPPNGTAAQLHILCIRPLQRMLFPRVEMGLHACLCRE
jgi:hypothetical protein